MIICLPLKLHTCGQNFWEEILILTCNITESISVEGASSIHQLIYSIKMKGIGNTYKSTVSRRPSNIFIIIIIIILLSFICGESRGEWQFLSGFIGKKAENQALSQEQF